MAFVLLSVSVSIAAGCHKNDGSTTINNDTVTNTTMKITVGSSVFSATLYDNASANAFKAKLPLTITMRDVNDNEKAYDFSDTLPTNAAVGGNIHAGDLMLYGNNCLVLFYESFNSTYSYSRLGKINNVAGLKTALGNGSVTVTFELN